MTNHYTRPDPDQLLTHVQQEETRQARGKLKIFLGYAAGVGKTYAMLEAAQQRHAEGVDVVAACVETHGRSETETLLAGLEIMPRRQIPYRGILLSELDLDGLLARRPQVALVDELAHTNAPGSRHPKRYQDVQELLEAGIDVYTTLNIQHLESLNDIVAQITGVIVRETVPDSVLDDANEIELIDLPTAELRQRLNEGKVYVPAQAAQAVRKFFRPGNLTALRELALRQAAERIDAQMLAYMQTHAITGPWPAGERLLVCVSPSPLSERLVRTARRLAQHLDAEWLVVYVETPRHIHLDDTSRDQVARTMRLAQELGAKTLVLPGNQVAETLVAYAQANNVTKIIAGKPILSRWTELWRGSLVDQIIRRSGDIDVYVISSQPAEFNAGGARTSSLPRPRWQRLMQSTLLVGLVTLLGLPLRPLIEPTNLVMLYLLAVITAAVRWGHSPAIWASFLSVLAFDVVFVPPYYTLVVADAQYLLTFAALLGTGLVISKLAAQAREQARAAQRRATQTAVQYELSQTLSTSVDPATIATALVAYTERLLGAGAAVLVQNNTHMKPLAASKGVALNEHETAVATWAWRHEQAAGFGTDTLSGSEGLYLPLKTPQAIVGILAVFPPQRQSLLSEQRRLLESFASQAAVAMERTQLAEKAQRAQLLHETEKLQAALLNSISHDLRTPLATITGALTALRDDRPLLNDDAQDELLATAAEEANRLNHLVGNLLDMTRLESGAMKISLEPGDVQDVIGVALSQLSHRLRRRQVQLDVPADLPIVPMDFVLVTQVLVNLIDNADKYSPPDKPLSIRVYMADNDIVIEVADRGSGIPPGEFARIFDKFYRSSQTRSGVGGTGLGLSISKGIVEAHGGRIWAGNRPGGGAVIAVALPRQGKTANALQATLSD